MKKVYMSEIWDPRMTGKSIVRCKDKVQEYIHEIYADRGGGINKVIK